MSGIVDYSLHGLITIRLHSAPQHIVDGLGRTLGPSLQEPVADPDLTVRFDQRMTPTGELRLVGLNAAAFDDESFYVLDWLGKRARIDFQRMGEPMEILCEEQMASIPLLRPIVALLLLSKGHVLLHSSSFVFDGKGILTTGWEKGGKTELLFAFMDAGASYLADDWTIVSEDGTIMGLTVDPEIWGWVLDQLPSYWSRLSLTDRARLRLLGLYRRAYRLLPEPSAKASFQRQLLHVLALEGGVPRAGKANAAPEVLFGDRIEPGPVPIDRVVFASVVEGKTSIRPIDSKEIVDRMISSQAAERQPLLEAYERFKFAFPARRSAFLEAVSAEEARLLRHALAGVPAYDLRHPYPVALAELREAAQPFLA